MLDLAYGGEEGQGQWILNMNGLLCCSSMMRGHKKDPRYHSTENLCPLLIIGDCCHGKKHDGMEWVLEKILYYNQFTYKIENFSQSSEFWVG